MPRFAGELPVELPIQQVLIVCRGAIADIGWTIKATDDHENQTKVASWTLKESVEHRGGPRAVRRFPDDRGRSPAGSAEGALQKKHVKELTDRLRSAIEVAASEASIPESGQQAADRVDDRKSPQARSA